MAAHAETPIHEASGIPLPLVPVPFEHMPNPPETNWHHHFHPRRSPLLSSDLPGGIALRSARLQRAVSFGNHLEYHQHFEGPPLPKTESERFRTIVLAHAGYIPEHAIVMRKMRTPKIVRLRDEQRQQLWEERHIRSGSPGEVRTFLGKYVLEQNLEGLEEGLVDEFLGTRDNERRRFLGNWLLAQAIERASEPVESMYRTAWKEGKIPQSLPYKPLSFVAQALGRQTHRDRLVNKMAQQLVA